MSTPTTCKVVAPATLKEGATFEATVDGITFTATVPEGGVGEGDTFEVAYPSKSEVNAFEVPSGKFRHTLCSCFNSCCCLFMMGWCCSSCVVGQVMQRLNFNFFGCPRVNADGTPVTGKRPPVCMMIAAASIATSIIGGVLFSVYPEYGSYPYAIFGWYMLIVTVITRYNMRKKFDIESNCCGDNCCGDCLSVWFCPCCSIIQMASHTHDHDAYPYAPLNGTGLKLGAPEIV